MEIKVIADKWMMPERQHPDDAGADLKADSTWRIEPGRTRMVGTGTRWEIPSGHVGLVFARSSLAVKKSPRACANRASSSAACRRLRLSKTPSTRSSASLRAWTTSKETSSTTWQTSSTARRACEECRDEVDVSNVRRRKSRRGSNVVGR